VLINITGNAQKTHHFDVRNTNIFWGGGTAKLSALELRCPFQMDWTPAVIKIIDPPLGNGPPGNHLH